MNKEQREYIVLGLLLIGIGLLVYFYIVKKPAPYVTPIKTGIGDATTPYRIILNGPILPNGTTLDTSRLNQPDYQSLVNPVYPTLIPGDIGNPNPFNGTYSATK